jgi:anti-sigma28 factor (negative regulator of flagellin synthesis)
MSINEITGAPSPLSPLKPRKPITETKESSPSSDEVQLSGEARSLYEAAQTKRMEEIRVRLNDGFYLSQEVTEKIVDALLEDLKKAKE